jgi:DNA-binding NarL/FixJ family response regulator
VRLVIVDDSVPFRSALRLSLEDEGFELVGEAGDGAQALVLLEEEKPDAMIVDLQMPGMDGLQLIPQIKERAPEMPIGVLTVAGKSLQADAQELGADAYFRKEEPIDHVIMWLKAVDAER